MIKCIFVADTVPIILKGRTEILNQMHLITHITGNVQFKSKLPILEVGKIIGEKLFGGLEFGGLEKNYFEEVPGILIANGILGLEISIQKIETDDSTSSEYVLSISPIHWAGNDHAIIWGKLDNYLSSLFKHTFKDRETIKLVEK